MRTVCCELARIVHLAALAPLNADSAVQGVRRSWASTLHLTRRGICCFRQVVDGLAGEQGMEGVRDEVPVLLDQILGGELVMLDGLPDERIR